MNKTIRVTGQFPIQMATVQLDKHEPWTPMLSPFVVKGPDGVERPAQMERHEFAQDSKSLRSVELWFASVGPGDYEVIRKRASVRDVAPQPGRFARGCIETAPCFLIDGVEHHTRWERAKNVPTNRDNERVYRRFGDFAVTATFSAKNFVGFVTVFDKLNVALYELCFHNCEPGSSDLFFDTLATKSDAHRDYTWPEPGSVGPVLIPARVDGKLNVLERKGRRPFQFVLFDQLDADVDSALLASFRHVAVSTPFAVGAQRIPMPDLSSKSAAIATRVFNERNALQSAIANGNQIGTGADQNKPGRIGFKSIWGGNYGGMTSGSYRFQVEGWQPHITGSEPGVCAQELATRAMMVDNRVCGVILSNGRPVDRRLEGGWDVSSSDLHFERSGALRDYRDGSFGFARAPMVVDPARFPTATWDALSSYSVAADRVSPIDWQHFDRAYQPHAALAELTGAPLSMLTLRAYAEAILMSLETGGFYSEVSYLHGSPQHGTEFGRAEGHMFACAAHAYRWMPKNERERWTPRFETFVSAMVAAQMPNGIFQAKMRKENQDPNNNAYVPLGKGVYAVAKLTEEALLVNALWCILELDILDVGTTGDALRAINQWASRGLWEFAWRKGLTGGAPVDYVCVRAAKRSGAPLASWWDLPDAAGFYNHDLTEVGAGLGYALMADSADFDLRACALHYCGKSTTPSAARAWLLQQNKDWDDRLPLLSALERTP